MKTKLSIIAALLSVFSFCFGAYLKDVPTEITQPDGSKIQCHITGDEFSRRVFDKDNYTIVQNPTTGYYVYAEQRGKNLAPTSYIVGRDNPLTKSLTPNLYPNTEKATAVSKEFRKKLVEGGQRVNNIGYLNNLVVFIRFSDQSEFSHSRTYSWYHDLFDDATADTSKSLKTYFQEISNYQAQVNTTLFPNPSGVYVVSYLSENSRAYYSPYNEVTNPIGYSNDLTRTWREHHLVADCMNWLDQQHQVPAGLNLDNDNDGNVDNVTFIIKGGADPWGNILWPHRWTLSMANASINGKGINDFNLVLEDGLHLGVLCHEMSHTFSYPDLYHYESTGINSVGYWDLMCNDLSTPQYHLEYLDYKYGHWTAMPELLFSPGTYSLVPRTTSRSAAYRVMSNNPDEFYVLEYRKKTGRFDINVPGTGLIVYRVNTNHDGNADGEDEIYVYRPQGYPTVDGIINSANYCLQEGRTGINSNTFPYGFLSEGMVDGGLQISNIGTAGDDISFQYGGTLPKIWTGSNGISWNVSLNWKNGIPTASDVVEIPGGLSNYPAITSTISCLDLHVFVGAKISIYAGTLNVLNDFTTAGELNLTNAASVMNVNGDVTFYSYATTPTITTGSKINIQGDLTFNRGSAVNLTNSTLEFNGTLDSSINVNSGQTLGNLKINKTAPAAVNFSASSTNELYIIGLFSNTAGSTFNYLYYGTIHFRGGYINLEGGHCYFSNGVVNIEGSTTTDIYEYDTASYFNDLTILKSVSSALVNLRRPLWVKGNFTITAGVVVAYGYPMKIEGNWYNNIGTSGYSEGNGVVEFTGSKLQAVFGETFNKIILNKSGGYLQFPVNTTTSCNYYDWMSGEYRVYGGTFIVHDLVDNGIFGTIYMTNGVINYTQDGAAQIAMNANITIDNGSFMVHGGNSDSNWAQDDNASLTMSNGLFEFVDKGIVITNTHLFTANITGGMILTAGKFVCNRADFQPTGGIIEMIGSQQAELSIVPGSYLNNLVIAKSASRAEGQNTTLPNQRSLYVVQAASDVNIHGYFHLTAGKFEPYTFTVTVLNSIQIAGQLNMQYHGTLTTYNDFIWTSTSGMAGANGTINCYGNWEFQTGCIVQLENTQVNLRADYGGTILNSSLYAHFGNLAIKGTQETPYFHVLPASTDSLLVLGSLTIDPNNTLDLAGKPARVINALTVPATANLTLGTGGYLYLTSDLTLDGTLSVGTGTCTVLGSFYPSSSSLLQIDGGSFIQDAPAYLEGSDTVLNGGIQMSAGILQITYRNVIMDAHETRSYGDGFLKVGGNFTATALNAFQMTSGELQMIGRTENSLTCNNGNYIFNLQINKYRLVALNLLSPITVKGQLYINSGKLASNSNTISLGGNWYNPNSENRFIPGTGTVIFNQAGGVQTISGATTFYNVTDSHTGNELQFMHTCTVGNTLFVSNIVYFQDNMTINLLNNNSSTATVEQHYGLTSTIASYDGGGTLRATGLGIIIVNDLVDAGIYGKYYATNGTIELHQDTGSWCDLNGNLYITQNGIINIYGGSKAYEFAYLANASILMDSGQLNFKSWGIKLPLNSYTFNSDISGGVISVVGDIYCYRTNFVPAGGTIEMTGTTDGVLDMAAGSSFYTLRINKGARSGDGSADPIPPLDEGGRGVNLPSSLRTSDFELRNSYDSSLPSSLRTSNFELRTSYDSSLPSSLRTSDFELRNSSDSSLPSSLRTSDFALRTSTRGYTALQTSAITIRGDMQIYSGILQSSYAITVYGNWTNTVGTSGFFEISNTVTFAGNSVDTGLLTSETFNNLVLNNTNASTDAFELAAGQTCTVGGNLTITDGTFEMNDNSTLAVTGNLVISSGAGLNANTDMGLNISVGGNWTDSNGVYNETQGFNPGTSTLTFNGAADQTITNSASVINAYNLIVNKTAGRFIPTKFCKVLGNLTLTRGEWYDSTTGYIHEFSGDVYLSVNGIWNGSRLNTIKLKGGNSQNFFYDCRTSYIYNLTIEKTAATTVLMQYPMVVAMTGTMTINSGTLLMNHKYFRTTGNVTINSTGKISLDSDAWLEVANTKTLTVNTGGYLEVIGASGHLAKITHQSTGNYLFYLASGATLSAEYATFEYMTANGVYLMNGSILDPLHPFSYCTFQNGVAGGTLLKIENNATITIPYASFPTNAGSNAKNVTKAANQGLINMSGASGAFSGASYESDPNNLINWNGPLPDLKIVSMFYNSNNLYVCDANTVDVTIMNNSAVGVGTPIRVDLYYTRASAPTTGTVGNQYMTINSLDAWASATVTFVLVSSDVAGTWTSYAFVDENASVAEAIETNNAFGPSQVIWNALPPVPTPTVSFNTETQKVELNWTYPLPVSRFRIYVDTDPNGTFPNLVMTTETPTYVEERLRPIHFYKITAERDLP